MINPISRAIRMYDRIEYGDDKRSGDAGMTDSKIKRDRAMIAVSKIIDEDMVMGYECDVLNLEDVSKALVDAVLQAFGELSGETIEPMGGDKR